MKRLLAILVLAVAACGPRISVTTLNPSPTPLVGRPAGAVEVYTSSIPTRPYIEVALLSASRGEADDHLPALRERAGAIGCDALVFTQTARTSTATGFVNGRYATSESVSGSSATCVVWDQRAPQGPPGAQ